MGKKGHLTNYIKECLNTEKYPNVQWKDQNQGYFLLNIARHGSKQQHGMHEQFLKVCISYTIRNF